MVRESASTEAGGWVLARRRASRPLEAGVGLVFFFFLVAMNARVKRSLSLPVQRSLSLPVKGERQDRHRNLAPPCAPFNCGTLNSEALYSERERALHILNK